MVKLSVRIKDSIKSLLLANNSIRKIEEILKVPKSSIHRFARKNNLITKNKPGRKKKLSTTNVTYMITQLTSNKTDSAGKLTKMLEKEISIKVSRQTVCRTLNNAGMSARTKKKKPAISNKNRKERLAFAKVHKDWTVEDWKRVIFSDETKLNRFGSDGRKWTWVRDGEALQPRNVKATVKGGGGSLMVWGCITAGGVGYLTEIEGIMDQHLYLEILKGELLDTIEYYKLEEEKVIFMQDNDPKHKAKLVMEHLKNAEFEVMVWPPQSPDLNPIENCWAHLKSKIYAYPKPANGIKELWGRIEAEWELISKDYLTNLYESMPRRMKECIKSKGFWTKY